MKTHILGIFRNDSEFLGLPFDASRHMLCFMKVLENNLAGQLLLAMPCVDDPRFHRAVILICTHSMNGAMGLIINKPISDFAFSDLLQQLGISTDRHMGHIRVHYGGPIEKGRGFVLHPADYPSNDTTFQVSDTFAMTMTRDVLEDIVLGRGPSERLLALGYAGWGPGQLEAEILQNGWLNCAAPADLVFGEGTGEKWSEAMETMGIDPRLLSAQGGHA